MTDQERAVFAAINFVYLREKEVSAGTRFSIYGRKNNTDTHSVVAKGDASFNPLV